MIKWSVGLLPCSLLLALQMAVTSLCFLCECKGMMSLCVSKFPSNDLSQGGLVSHPNGSHVDLLPP